MIERKEKKQLLVFNKTPKYLNSRASITMSVEVGDVNLMESPPDKVVLVGDVGVGKTSLFLRFKTGEFSENTSHNPREGEYHKKWQLDDNEVSVSAYNYTR